MNSKGLSSVFAAILLIAVTVAVWELPLAIILWIIVAFLVALGVLGLLLVITFLCDA